MSKNIKALYTLIMGIMVSMVYTPIMSKIRLSYDGTAFEHIKIFRKGKCRSYYALSLKDQTFRDGLELHILYYPDRYSLDHEVMKDKFEHLIKIYQFDRNPKDSRRAHYRIICRYNNEIRHCGDFVRVHKISENNIDSVQAQRVPFE